MDCFWNEDEGAWTDSEGNIKIFDADFAFSNEMPHAFGTQDELPSPPLGFSIIVYFGDFFTEKIVAIPAECDTCQRRVLCQYPASNVDCGKEED